MPGHDSAARQLLPVMNLAQYMMCAACSVALNDEHSDDGALYDHPVLAADHEAQPVPADYVGRPTHLCHICADRYPLWLYGTAPIVSVNSDRGTVTHFSAQWRICFHCAALVERGDGDGLAGRALKVSSGPMAAAAPPARVAVCRTIAATAHSLRGLLPHTAFPPAAIMPDVMPQIRQRLIDLYSGRYAVMLPVNFAWNDVCESLTHAPLYWINNKFTDMVRTVSPSQPLASITEELLPSPHGLLAWPQPVGAADELAAVSWRPTDRGWELIGYRSIGNYLPKDDMTALRHEVGWLIPIHVCYIDDGDRIGGAHSLGPLATTWLLIAQQLADITTTRPKAARTPAVRRDQRQRQTPQVRLVQLKASTPALPSAVIQPAPVNGRSRARPDHRFWVSEHPRQQAFGPHRSQRRRIIIAPFIKGDQDKPLKLSTAVRVLGNKKAAPDRQPTDTGAQPPPEQPPVA